MRDAHDVEMRDAINSPLASRIRSLREGADLSQGELAQRLFVSRQTVINWEMGRTLPDIESLKLLSQAFGITLDALLDERAEAYLCQTEHERKIIKITLVLDLVIMIEMIIGSIVTGLAYEFLDWDMACTVANIESVIRACILIPLAWVSFKMNRIKAEYGLESIVDVAAFLEGYPPEATLPQTFVWRWLLPHWTLVTSLTWGFFAVVTFVPLFALKFA